MRSFFIKIMAIGLAAIAEAGVVAVAGTRADDDRRAEAGAVTLRVLSYNVNDMPSLFGGRSSPRLDYIGEDLARRRAEGTAPHVVLLQEAFTRRGERLVELSGYPHVRKGPGRRDQAEPVTLSRRIYASHYRVPRREPRGVLTNSGLYILSEYPIVEHNVEMFGEDACTGFDCLANKAALHVRIDVPGLAEPLDLLTAHMQANVSSESSPRRRLAAHWRQTDMIRSFLKRVLNGNRRESILAGDFNLHAPIERYDHFVQEIGARNLGLICVQDPDGCVIGRGTTPHELWRYTNDYHFKIEGPNLTITPIHMVRNYDQRFEGRPLSDHLGFEAVYRIEERAVEARSGIYGRDD